ncbi:hypothetical protein [Sphingobium sp. TKS]|uniref:hypothetical protein n=1 Tax=Sphingobium sp. TKS TaxID=1315974 RepID=UPI0007705894|nr:hypothetical protein [Sphingobium sp. TKS]AMK21572.1 hypothetical protein K426_03075 [Sphingobium sp. TKS]
MTAPSRRSIVILCGIALVVVLLANAHLVYVATSSQPRCVAHAKAGEQPVSPGVFTAAQPSC